ncbi:TPA: hypothetical protein QHU19_004943 [Klebsiella aerogenes]|uniref:hypothetical protein n=1 Tax=Klebsiella aerogenes TaxID=548 RepID=UPI0002AB077E|nr:hypothetical protein [Klebsiella aerogenes]AML36126.1 Hypothetical protein EAG7_02381 [Klebsiella aerogenes]EKU7808903.1 hypothetical protein [Klebsiella aerogenes]EKW5210367.1 hypothetical protein [Klebsiella aerogenes]ELA2475985.1 hypothetical protein [Klebsiella aerogenes]ELS4538567.1 hypothetical protein [Klebsiella aerogenes]
MTTLFAKIMSTPGRWMQNVIQQDIEQSNNSKITTDANGNAVLNMNNKEVRESMQARMKELAAKR